MGLFVSIATFSKYFTPRGLHPSDEAHLDVEDFERISVGAHPIVSSKLGCGRSLEKYISKIGLCHRTKRQQFTSEKLCSQARTDTHDIVRSLAELLSRQQVTNVLSYPIISIKKTIQIQATTR